MRIAANIQTAKAHRHPIVALESTLITHGLPFPTNLETAQAAEEAVREAGAIPATIAILEGEICIGLTSQELQRLAKSRTAKKASRRDLAILVTTKQDAGTTVAATLFLAHQAGIHFFATGGIGGVHPDLGNPFDISADLLELSRHPVLTVCAGAKNILDLARTLEVLETLSVPIIGYQTIDFPAFYLRSSGLPLPYQMQSPEEVARVFRTHWRMRLGGMLLAQPIDAKYALDPEEFVRARELAEKEAQTAKVHGSELTPFLLKRIAEITAGRSLPANRDLIVANARLAGQIAVHFHQSMMLDAEG